MSPMILELQASINHLRVTRPTWFAATSPDSILLLAAYNRGGLHATTEIATGGPTPDWNINDISADASTLLAYIRVEQIKLQRSMGGDATTSPPLEDPEPFDESTGPMPSDLPGGDW